MRVLLLLLGLLSMLLGLYVLWQNIISTTNIKPYWWQGIAADFSILLLTLGLVKLLLLPTKRLGYLGWVLIVAGLWCAWVSRFAILTATTLTEFFTALVALLVGYRLLAISRFRF
jgi:hypothetical protein